MTITAIPVEGIGVATLGDNIAELIIEALSEHGLSVEDSDILVVASKVVSKTEGRVVHGSNVVVSSRALEIAGRNDFDPIHVQLALDEAKQVISSEGVLITRTQQGIVCNFSGVDRSNAPHENYILLPSSPDNSAKEIKKAVDRITGKKVAVIVSDTQGRPWRKGSLNLAIGCAGIGAFKHNRGRRDLYGRTLERSMICQVDELAALAEPLMGQAGERIPVVIIRGYQYEDDGSKCSDINRTEEEDILSKKE